MEERHPSTHNSLDNPKDVKYENYSFSLGNSEKYLGDLPLGSLLLPFIVLRVFQGLNYYSASSHPAMSNFS